MSDLPPVLLGIQVLLYFYPYLNSGHHPGRWVEAWKERSQRLLDKISAVPQLKVFVAQVSLDYVLDFVRSGSGSELAERLEESLKTNRLSVLPRRSHLVAPSDIPFHELKLALESGFSVVTHERSEYLIPVDESDVFGNAIVVKTVEEFLEWLDLALQTAEPAASELAIASADSTVSIERPFNPPALAPNRSTSARQSSQHSEAIAIALSVFLGRLIGELEQLGMSQHQQLAEAHQYLKQFGDSPTADTANSPLTDLPSILATIEKLGGAMGSVTTAGLIPDVTPSPLLHKALTNNANSFPGSEENVKEKKADDPVQTEPEQAVGKATQKEAAAEKEAAIASSTPVTATPKPTRLIAQDDADNNSDGSEKLDESGALDFALSAAAVVDNPIKSQPDTVDGLVTEPAVDTATDSVSGKGELGTKPVNVVEDGIINTIKDGIKNGTNGVPVSIPGLLIPTDPIDSIVPFKPNSSPLILNPEISSAAGGDFGSGGGSLSISSNSPNRDDGNGESSLISVDEELDDFITPLPAAKNNFNPDSNKPIAFDSVPDSSKPTAERSNQPTVENSVSVKPTSTSTEAEVQRTLLNGAGKKNRYPVSLGDHLVIENFGGAGTGSSPTPGIYSEIDTLKLQGAGLTAENMLLKQIKTDSNKTDLLITFGGVSNTSITLKDFKLEQLDNFPVKQGTESVGNIIFDGQSQLEDAFDVIKANDNPSSFQVFRATVTTFLNDLSNTARGRDNSKDVIHGLGGNDVLSGLSGNDTLGGGNGNDSLHGGDGNDTLYGDDGNDLLDGGAGDDALYGGAGGDRFLLSSYSGTDTIFGFEFGKDWLQLADGIDPNQITVSQRSSSTLIEFNHQTLAILDAFQSTDVLGNSALLFQPSILG